MLLWPRRGALRRDRCRDGTRADHRLHVTPRDRRREVFDQGVGGRRWKTPFDLLHPGEGGKMNTPKVKSQSAKGKMNCFILPFAFFILPLPIAIACPFCTALKPTWSQQREAAKVVA